MGSLVDRGGCVAGITGVGAGVGAGVGVGVRLGSEANRVLRAG